MNTFFAKTTLAVVVFVVSLGFYWYPIHSKGYTPSGDFVNLTRARSFAVTGTYSIENSSGMLVSTESVKEERKNTALTNPLTPLIYGYIFKYAEVDSLSLPSWISVVLAAVFNVLIFLLIDRLFGVRVGFISAIVLALTPIRVLIALHFGSYEFAMIFLAVALWLFLGSREGIFKASLARIVFASAFFALAALARNALLISFVPFVFYDFYKNRSYRRSLIFLLPFLIIFGSTLTPYSWLGGSNAYVGDMSNQPFSLLGEIFPDPYTAYHDRDAYIQNLQSQNLDRSSAHFLKQWGYKVSTGDRLQAYVDSAVFYAKETASLTNLGGPLVLFFMLVGAYWLFRYKRELLGLLALWLLLWLGGLVYFETANSNHFVEIIVVVALFAGLGMTYLIELAAINPKEKVIFGAVIFLSLAGHLYYADKWRLYDAYRSSYEGAVQQVSEPTRALNKSGTIAAGSHPNFASSLYYVTDRDIVYFSPATIQKLVSNGRLKEALGLYNVTSAVGFSSEMSEDIVKISGLTVVPWNKNR